MSLELIVRAIGYSHGLQIPLTILLSKRLDLVRPFSDLALLPAQIARNMAFASVILPTCCGSILGLWASDVVAGGPLRALAWVMAAFWTWRLWRQLVLRRFFPAWWNWGLGVIFCVQGPTLAIVLVASAPT